MKKEFDQFEGFFKIFIPLKTLPGEVWHPEVIKLQVWDTKKNESAGIIFCDLFPRAEKADHSCHYTIQCSKQLPDGSYQLPVVVVTLSFRTFSKSPKAKLTYS